MRLSDEDYERMLYAPSVCGCNGREALSGEFGVAEWCDCLECGRRVRVVEVRVAETSVEWSWWRMGAA